MNGQTKALCLAVGIMCFSPMLGGTPSPSGQQVPLSGPATRLTSVEYWPAPNDKQAKLRLDGAEMTPLPDTKFEVKQLTVHAFSEAGKLQAVVEAPECVYAPLDGVANSSGHLQLKLMDDKIHVEGDGFEWQQNDDTLSISNHVSTVIKTGAWKFSAP